MKKNMLVLVVVLVIGLVGSLFASGLTSGKGKMSGIVTDKETGEPIPGVTVKLFFPLVNAAHLPSPVTGKDGRWKAVFVRDGNWNIDFEKAGYEISQTSFVVDSTPGTKNVSIETQLVKLPTGTAPVLSEDIGKEITLATNLMAENKYDEALQKLLKILNENKDAAGINIVALYIGNCYGAKSEYANAIEYYQKALDAFPNNKDMIISIGNAYNNLKDFGKAMEWFGKLSVDDITNSDTLYNIGVVAYNGGNFENAAMYFKKATTISPTFADAFYQLGMTYTGLDKPAEAVAALKKFMELAPDSPNFETAKDIVEAFK